MKKRVNQIEILSFCFAPLWANIRLNEYANKPACALVYNALKSKTKLFARLGRHMLKLCIHSVFYKVVHCSSKQAVIPYALRCVLILRAKLLYHLFSLGVTKSEIKAMMEKNLSGELSV